MTNTHSHQVESREGRRARPVSGPAAHLLGAVSLAAVAAAGLADGVIVPVQPAYAQALNRSAPPAVAQSLPSFADVVERIKPAVVSVRVKTAAEQVSSRMPDMRGFGGPDFGLPDDHPFRDFFRRFRGDDDLPRGMRPAPRRPSRAQGSGFFISPDGYLVTNNHVIDKSSEIEILMDDGRSLDAKVVGTDPKTDIALLKVTEDGPFPYVEFAPRIPRIGDWVLAVGNPFGLGGTVTAGIVSAHGRNIGAGPYDDFIQIDAPVNRGNSGGPTFNLAGQVVGVNTAITSPSGGNVGIAFAIPAATVERIVAELKDKGTVERGYLGVQIQPVTEDIAKSVGLQKARGAIVARVDDNTPAAAAGVKTGDIVLAVNGDEIRDARDLSRKIAWLDPGATAELQIWRDGDMRRLSVKLGRMPGGKVASLEAREQATELAQLGLTLAPAAGDRKGVAVVKVEPGSAAQEKGFRSGDVIVEVAGQEVERPADVREAIADVRKEGRKAVLFRVEAEAGARFIALQVPAA